VGADGDFCRWQIAPWHLFAGGWAINLSTALFGLFRHCPPLLMAQRHSPPYQVGYSLYTFFLQISRHVGSQAVLVCFLPAFRPASSLLLATVTIVAATSVFRYLFRNFPTVSDYIFIPVVLTDSALYVLHHRVRCYVCFLPQ